MEEINYRESSSQGCVASTSDNMEAMCSETPIGFRGGRQLHDCWILDLGAAWHMTPCWDWFYTYELILEGYVFMENDHALEIAGVGTVKLKMYVGTIRTIQGIQHVKGLKKNLFSVG